MNQDQVDFGTSEGRAELERDVFEFLGRAGDTIEQFAEERPHAAVGIALGIGFLLGGGLTPKRLYRLAVAVGGPILSRQLAGQATEFAFSALSSVGSGEHASATRRPRKRPQT